MTERFVAGLIGAPFGLKGFVKIRPLSGEIEHLLKLQSVFVRRDGEERVFQIEESTPAFPALLMKFAGFDSPEAAKALGGGELLVDREQASPLGPGEFYIEDLRGLAVAAGPAEGPAGPGTGSVPKGAAACAEGEILGHITDIIEGGGGELAEIRLSNGELKLVPFRDEFFPDIDPEKGRVVLVNRWILE